MDIPKDEELLDMLRDVLDPDLQLPIVDLGLVYRAQAFEDRIEVDITLTSPACPVGDIILEDVVSVMKERTGYEKVEAQIVWNPPWNKDLMSEELKLILGIPI